MYICCRLRSTVQNRAIMRYMLFVAWKLYKCRFATATNKMFLNHTPRLPLLCISPRSAALCTSYKITRSGILAFCLIKLIPELSYCKTLIAGLDPAIFLGSYTQAAGFALCTKLPLVFAKRKLAGFAEFAYSVAKAQSQTRFSPNNLCFWNKLMRKEHIMSWKNLIREGMTSFTDGMSTFCHGNTPFFEGMCPFSDRIISFCHGKTSFHDRISPFCHGNTTFLMEYLICT